jgi:hypothetical protein
MQKEMNLAKMGERRSLVLYREVKNKWGRGVYIIYDPLYPIHLYVLYCIFCCATKKIGTPWFRLRIWNWTEERNRKGKCPLYREEVNDIHLVLKCTEIQRLKKKSFEW